MARRTREEKLNAITAVDISKIEPTGIYDIAGVAKGMGVKAYHLRRAANEKRLIATKVGPVLKVTGENLLAFMNKGSESTALRSTNSRKVLGADGKPRETRSAKRAREKAEAATVSEVAAD
jgi:hypothetical protein